MIKILFDCHLTKLAKKSKEAQNSAVFLFDCHLTNLVFLVSMMEAEF